MPSSKKTRNQSKKAAKQDTERLAYQQELRMRRKEFKKDVKEQYTAYLSFNCPCTCKICLSTMSARQNATILGHLYNNKPEKAEKALEKLREFKSSHLTYLMETPEQSLRLFDGDKKVIHDGKANDEGVRLYANDIKNEVDNVSEAMEAYKHLYIENYL